MFLKAHYVASLESHGFMKKILYSVLSLTLQGVSLVCAACFVVLYTPSVQSSSEALFACSVQRLALAQNVASFIRCTPTCSLNET